jgi:hypothetical protein
LGLFHAGPDASAPKETTRRTKTSTDRFRSWLVLSMARDIEKPIASAIAITADIFAATSQNM